MTVNVGTGWLDYDGDGWMDLFVANDTEPNRLYRNRGDWKFEDVTDSAGVRCEGQSSTGAVWADVDADGDLDLLSGPARNCSGDDRD